MTVSVVAATSGEQNPGEQGHKEEGGKTGSGHPRGVVKLLSHTLKLRHGVASVDLRCQGAGSCDSEMQLTEQVSTRAHGKRRRTLVIGSARYSISAGRTTTIHMKIDAAGLAALKRARGNLAATLATKAPYAVLGKVDIKR